MILRCILNVFIQYLNFYLTLALLNSLSSKLHISPVGGGRHGYGMGVVTSLKTFDREKQKEYLMPIIMKDSGHPPVSGTNTLTITIGDRNDNKHFPGHKDIFVYNYKGESSTVETLSHCGEFSQRRHELNCSSS